MQKEMNLQIFQDNLLMAIDEIKEKGKIYSLKEIVTTLAFHSPLVPIWINIIMLRSEDKKIFFQLDVSLRFRKPSLLRNQETGHAPFKVIT